MPDHGTIYLLVFLAGLIVGLAELLSRHRDYPIEAAASLPSLFYLLLNGSLSVLALVIVSAAPPTWLLDAASQLDVLKTVLLVGFGAAAFFRSSFFKLRTGDGDISVGPGLVIDVFLSVIDDAVDRRLGERRLDDVTRIMHGVSFDKARVRLPTLCFAALKRLPAETQQQAALQIGALADTNEIDDHNKAVALGLQLMTLTGRPILTKAVKELGTEILAA